jgi:CRP/FNR family transcriptional regulator, cyclic AMP receptor protein
MDRSLHSNITARRLKDLALFSECSTKELCRMELLMTEAKVPAGRVLTSCTERGAEFFIVVSGTASVWREGVRLDVVGPGGFFGELALFDHGVRTASVIADTDMELFVLSAQEFRSQHFLIAPVMQGMLKVFSERLRRADEGWTGESDSPRSTEVDPHKGSIPIPSLH